MSRILLLVLLPFCVRAQTNFGKDSTKAGIHFEARYNWSELLQKAKLENKYIFIDCYTTWCMPCKKMEKDIFSKEDIGNYFSENFISVRFQIDTTVKDDSLIKGRYPDAKYIKNFFAIRGYPTLLFLNPDGKLVSRKEGLMEASELLDLARNVVDPKKNYYGLLEEFKNGKLEYEKMAMLANTALELKDTVTAKMVANEYLLYLKKKTQIYKDDFAFIKKFTKRSIDVGFDIVWRNTSAINKVLGNNDDAQVFLFGIIYEETIGQFFGNAEPNWIKLSQQVEKKYGAYYADRVVTAGKANWYSKTKDLKMSNKYLVAYVEKYVFPHVNEGHWPAFTLNNYAWDVFLYSNSQEDLKKALNWSKRVVLIDPNPNWMDTYSNLLYKNGQKELAIKWQEIAVKLAPSDKDLHNNLEKMKKGEPTWPPSN